jgi:hypothetical protein
MDPQDFSTLDKFIYIRRIFLLTNEGILLLRNVKENDKCPNCPPSFFCPRGPLVKVRIPYDDVYTFVVFPNMPQKIVILFRQSRSNKDDPPTESMHDM